MRVRGLRGAITVAENTKEAILEGTALLLKTMLEENDVPLEEIASVFFTVTPDLNKVFPAKGARQMGFDNIPLMCMTEIPVEGALEKCIRILIHYNTEKLQKQIRPIYLRNAIKLRPDLKND